MRNVTIVESNVEPNKEHLWFYNGKLKWFGPNGWEDICVCKSPSPSSTTTTTPKPVVPPATTTTTTTSSTTSTPIPNSIKFTNKTSVPLTLTRVNSVDEGLSSPPIQPNQYYILVHNANDTDTDSYIDMFAIPESGVLPPFSSLKITAFNNEGQEYDVPYEHYQDAMGINLYKFSFKELINKRVTEVFIYGSLEETTTTSTTSTTSTTTPPPPKKIGLSNQVYPNTTLGVAITANNLNNISPSELQSIRSGSYTSIDDYPTLTRKYLAVVRPKDSNYSKEAIVAEIVLVGTDYGEGQYSLYPIETIEGDSNKSFLFDLSKKPVDTPYIEQVNLYSYNSITMSTIPPFIDGNIPPLADEK